MEFTTKKYLSKTAAIAICIGAPLISAAQDTQVVQPTGFANPLFNTMLCIILILLIMIITLSKALRNFISSDYHIEQLKKKKAATTSTHIKVTLSILLLSVTELSAQVQTNPNTKTDLIGGLDQFTFYMMAITIAAEVIVLFFLYRIFKRSLDVEKIKKEKVRAVKPAFESVLDRINGTVEIEKEGEILLHHEYDGIRELDNNLPPWWKYGFYLTILVSVIYMVNYHISKTGPLQAEEYTNSIKKAEAEIAEYMKNSASNVDESTVKLLTGESEIKEGKDIFMASCAACHGRNGEGTVGPNLADEYWLHGGSVADIFKTIKYGWPDKGMKSWKEDLSPVQIAQVASFIRTLKGTNPPNGKEKQGELYVDLITSDSTSVKQDTLTRLTSQTLK